jgi:chaperonin GroEL (HSP60 family)
MELLKECETLKAESNSDLLTNTVTKIVADACMTPLRQILNNADLSSDFIIEMIKQKKDFNYGYDVRKEDYSDMIESGIIDPQKVTATAIKNAASVCSSLLSVGCVVLNNQNNYDQGVQLVQLSEDMY